MKHKFALHEMVDIPNHNRIGNIIFIDLFGGKDNQPRYLLDCFPGAVGHYIWCVHPDGYGDDKIIAANWFDEDELIPLSSESPS
jgi:hypothetical protein